MKSPEYDVAVVGGGSGGYAAARTASDAGLKVIVIEGGREVGGLCILRGCMPTKALLYAAEVRHLAQYGGVWGMKPGEVDFNWTAVMARKDGLIREFAEYREQQLKNGSFTFLRNSARFLNDHALALNNGETIQARHFVISTGSVVARPPLPQLSSVGYLTSDEALKLERLPKSLIILGGGPVAVEFAQMFARFDVDVTLIQRGDRLLKSFDPDATAVVDAALRREGITLHTNTRLGDAYRDGAHKVVTFLQGGRRLESRAEEILFALGRVPNTSGLDLDKAGVQTDRGRIVANDLMRTSVPHIYAAGDCTGPHEIVHIAVQQGEIAAHNIAHPDRPRHLDSRLLINVVFTDPQVATVGLTENEARAGGISYVAASFPFNDHGKSLIMEARDGFVKLLASLSNGSILGGCCAGPAGGDLIHEVVAAMAGGMTVHQLATMPHYHPTLAEIWTYPAEELAQKLDSTGAESIARGLHDAKAHPMGHVLP